MCVGACGTRPGGGRSRGGSFRAASTYRGALARFVSEDVLMLPVEDGYRQIVQKVLGGLRWAVHGCAVPVRAGVAP